MKNKFKIVVQMVTILGFLLSISGMGIREVQAATCTWEGDNGPDWAVPGNWTCGHVPTTGDDIAIPDVTVDPTINAATTGIDANTISIVSGAVLTVNATTNSLVIYTDSTFTNDGEIVVNGLNPGTNGLSINSPAFANDGTVTINAGYLKLHRGGTHTGTFVGSPETVLNLDNQWGTPALTFSAVSNISVPIVMVNGATGNEVNIYGEFSPSLISPETSQMQISSAATVNLDTNNILMPAEVTVLGTLNVLASSAMDIATFKVTAGSFSNTNELNITSSFDFISANLSGSGDIIIQDTATTVKVRGGTISGKTIRNDATANWTLGGVTLTNNAVFENNGTFNANATTTMTGTAPAAFINNGNFIKNTAGTTTTMNVPFTNNGSVEVVDGSLVFQQGMENGDNVVLNLGGGTLDPGETLTIDSGDSLIGSGTLSANLVNAGTVSPGNSAGIITVLGDYTPEYNGQLIIELGGTTPGTEYDQLVVTGDEEFDGILDVILINGFSPEVGDSFTILTYGNHTSTFKELNLPNLGLGLKWYIQCSDNAFVLHVIPSGGSVSGVVTYTGNLPGTTPIQVSAHLAIGEEPVASADDIISGELYTIQGLPPGSYYISAFIDTGNDGGPPTDDDPLAWYDANDDGIPDAVEVQDGTPTTNIDITLVDPKSNIYLPLIIR